MISTGTPIPAGLPTTAAPRPPSTDGADPPPTPVVAARDRGGAVAVAAPAEAPAAATPEEAPAPAPPDEAPTAATPEEAVAADPGVAPTATGSEADGDPDSVDTGPVPRLERLRDALPSLPGPGLTVAGGTVLGAGLVGLGAALDIALGDGLGLGFRVTFVVTCVVIAFAVRVRALGAAVVLPPLLYAAAATLQTVTAGQTTGRRAAALDVATTLALTAPLLFLGTAVAAAIALSRGLAHLVRR